MQDGLAVVTQGIANGDKVVVDGQYRLSEGSRVKIDTASPPAPAAATGKTG
jgi:multidrug efflux system membrane fusion protein